MPAVEVVVHIDHRYLGCDATLLQTSEIRSSVQCGLEVLLRRLGAETLILTGFATDICVLFTANDAYMRDLRIFAPADCIVSNTPVENDHALRQIGLVLKGNLSPSAQLHFRSR